VHDGLPTYLGDALNGQRVMLAKDLAQLTPREKPLTFLLDALG